MAKAKFERRKPHVNIGTIGHVDHGKTTLTSALTKVMGERGMAKFISYDEVAKASKVDDKELLDLVELEVRELLTKYEFPGDKIPIVVGSATKALEGDQSPLGVPAILKLLEAVDRYIPTPVRAVEKPFLMPIEDVFTISGRGTVVTGRWERGVGKGGDGVEGVGWRRTGRMGLTGVEMVGRVADVWGGGGSGLGGGGGGRGGGVGVGGGARRWARGWSRKSSHSRKPIADSE